MSYKNNILPIIALTVCFSTSARANNPTHVITMNQEADTEVTISVPKINISTFDIVRFWKKVDKKGPIPDQSVPQYSGLGHCWIWTGGKSKGYGTFWLDGTDRFSHRVSFFLTNGFFPEEGMVCHRCDNPACVNPDHLFKGTALDNARDRFEKGRFPKGEELWQRRNPERIARGDRNGSRTKPERLKRGDDHARSVLTSEKVLEIRRRFAAGETQRSLANEFGVGTTTMMNVVHGRTWRHI